jgi:predicted Fe-S protein YdhL (DUF1289 family)
MLVPSTAIESMAATGIASVTDSPCNGICALDPVSGLCRGCGRSLGEIESWVRYGDDERRRIMAELPRRLRTSHVAGSGPVP